MEDKPLSRQDHDYVFHFRRYRDIYRAAERAHIPKNQAKKFHNRIEIGEEIERQDNIVLAERAAVQVKAEMLTNDLLDSELLKLILLDAEKSGDVKRRSIELGYVLTGRIESGNTRSLEAKEGPDAKPNFYQAFVPVGIPVNVSPILPEEHKHHKFEIAPPPAKPAPTSQAEPVSSPVRSGTPIQAGRIKIG
jgi:hypothetical protein